jgi:putative RNA 2'-phosphotransferase
MTEKEKTRISKFLSLVLRHQPQFIGLQLDANGWADVGALLQGCADKDVQFTLEQLREIVATNPKQRFALSQDGGRIRANQGHSVEVELALRPQQPPGQLYHGTVEKNLEGIRKNGLQKMGRHHVHLSADRATAQLVGSRRGQPVVLIIKAAQLWAAGHLFYLSDNGVWLTDAVPPAYIEAPQAE